MAIGITSYSTFANNGTGWASYGDDQYTSSSPFVLPSNTWTAIPNNAANIIDFAAPTKDFDGFYDNSTGTVKVNSVGDSFYMSIRFKVISSQENASADFGIDIGGSFGIIFPGTFKASDSAGIEKPIYIPIFGYQGSTFLANGGTPMINAKHEMSIYDITYVIGRSHSNF